jgi:hypothetical protein
MVSIIGAGDADLAKHEFVFTAAFDIVTFLLVSDLIHRSLWKAPSPSSTITEPAIQVLEPTGTVVSMSAKVINHNA